MTDMEDVTTLSLMQTTALHTDHYELTMLAASLADGTGDRRATFEVFARRLPLGRRYGVVAGLERLLDALERFCFGPAEIAFLIENRVVDESVATWLAGYRFAGDVVAYREGELYFPYSPVLTVDATFAEAVVLETLTLSILNHDTAVASAAARMVDAAAGRPLMEMGGRRTDDEAAVASARAAHLVGFAATSNLEAGRRYGIPTAGTSAHAFILAHRDEATAFASQLDTLGVDTTLLVDTYNVDEAIRTAIRLARERGVPGPGAVRIDSGDLTVEATKARALLDQLGATSTRIVCSGDLDEYSIEQLVRAGAPIDSFGVGTCVVTGSGHPTAGFVYKLVAIEGDDGGMVPVAKRSVGKATVGGRKHAWRSIDPDGFAASEVVALGDPPSEIPWRPLQHVAMTAGLRQASPTNAEVAAHHRAALAELRLLDRLPEAGPPLLTGRPLI